MPIASPGILRATGRKTATALRQTNHNAHHPHGQGSGGPGHHRGLHVSSFLSHSGLLQEQPTFLNHLTHSLEQIRPRNPPHKLFSSTRNFITNVFTKLSSPGFRAPLNALEPLRQTGGRPMHYGVRNAAKSSIQSGVSFPTRYTLQTKARSLGGNTFLPRAPVPARGPVATQVGLGTARNFSSGRPIFQNLVDNAPVALRAFYEADLDLDKKGANFKARELRNKVKSSKGKSSHKTKMNITKSTKPVVNQKTEESVISSAEIEQYFRSPASPAVTTQLLIPLAPTPTNRVPLSALDLPGPSAQNSGRLLPLRELGAMHASHSTHALRVHTLFTRLDQANVWSRGGVMCSAHSSNARKVSSPGETSNDNEGVEGVCTVLKVEFVGWTAAEVRSVIGESGTGWCVLEEIWHDDESNSVFLSEAESDCEGSLFSPPPGSPLHFDMGMSSIEDGTHSFVMPTLEISSSFLAASERNPFAEESTPYQQPMMEYDDPWSDEMSMISSPSISRSSSSSSLGLIIDPPSENGWYGFSSRLVDASVASHTFDQYEPRELLF